MGRELSGDGGIGAVAAAPGWVRLILRFETRGQGMVATTPPRTRTATSSERASSESSAAMPGPHINVSTTTTSELADPATGPPRVLVTLATYNEIDNLRPLVEAIRARTPGALVSIIDDNSPDGTGKLADDLAASLPGVDVIHRAGKLGLGTAIIEGMEYAIANGFDYVLNLDADFSHPPRFIPAILDGMTHYDVMIGSRYVPGGGFEGHQFDLKRKFMSTGINVYGACSWVCGRGTTAAVSAATGCRSSRRSTCGTRPLARIFVHGRDLVLVPPGRLHDRRDADHLREPPRRRVQDQQVRSLHGPSDHLRAGRRPRLGDDEGQVIDEPAGIGRVGATGRTRPVSSEHAEHWSSTTSGTLSSDRGRSPIDSCDFHGCQPDDG